MYGVIFNQAETSDKAGSQKPLQRSESRTRNGETRNSLWVLSILIHACRFGSYWTLGGDMQVTSRSVLDLYHRATCKLSTERHCQLLVLETVEYINMHGVEWPVNAQQNKITRVWQGKTEYNPHSVQTYGVQSTCAVVRDEICRVHQSSKK